MAVNCDGVLSGVLLSACRRLNASWPILNHVKGQGSGQEKPKKSSRKRLKTSLWHARSSVSHFHLYLWLWDPHFKSDRRYAGTLAGSSSKLCVSAVRIVSDNPGWELGQWSNIFCRRSRLKSAHASKMPVKNSHPQEGLVKAPQPGISVSCFFFFFPRPSSWSEGLIDRRVRRDGTSLVNRSCLFVSFYLTELSLTVGSQHTFFFKLLLFWNILGLR